MSTEACTEVKINLIRRNNKLLGLKCLVYKIEYGPLFRNFHRFFRAFTRDVLDNSSACLP